MAKICKESCRYDQSFMEYEISYSTDAGMFFTDVQKMLPGMEDYFDSFEKGGRKVDSHGDTLDGLCAGHYRRIGYKKLIVGLTQKELEDNVKAFHRSFVKTGLTISKVILYKLSYSTKTGDAERMRNISDNSDRFMMEFKYYIATKRSFGDTRTFRRHPGDGHISDWDVKNYKEMPWSQELEDFIHQFEDSFDKLIQKMKPFFETEGKIMELIGKNILAQ